MVPIGAHKANALRGHLDLSWQLITGGPIYDTPPMFGSWWPPFALAALTPFAVLDRLADGLGRGAFVLASFGLLAWGVVRLPVASRNAAVLAVAAVAGAVQRNFENLNLNAPLLAMIVAGAIALERDDERRAGAWFGAAAALKVFPGLLLVYLLLRGRWRGAAVGGATGLLLTALSLARYGWSGASQRFETWLALTREGVGGLLGANQSLAALIDRLGGGRGVWLVACAALGAICVAAWRRPRPPVAEVALVTLLALFFSPISWPDAFLLAIPAWALVLAAPPPVHPRVWRAALGLAAFGTSGVLTFVSRPVRLATFDLSLFTWGTLLLLLLLVIVVPPAKSVGDPVAPP